MNDRELLELAAKVYQADNPAWNHDPVGGFRDGFMRVWNPLTDDGDALRLVVRVGLDITFYNGYQEVHADSASGDQLNPAIEQYGSDRCAATRRAIVRAAAEIGKAMP